MFEDFPVHFKSVIKQPEIDLKLILSEIYFLIHDGQQMSV